MNFESNDDQSLFLSALSQFLLSQGTLWKPAGDARFAADGDFDRALEESGFLGCALEDGMGVAAATLLVHEIAKLPVVVEVAASALLLPILCAGLPRPIAVTWGALHRPIRFLPEAKSLLVIEDTVVSIADLTGVLRSEVESIFAYPLGLLDRPGDVDLTPLNTPASIEPRLLWQVAIAAEITGALAAALASVVEHVSSRQQFGRPLGSFQAVQHRLAEDASLIEAGKWLTFKAAQTLSPADAAIAAGYAQSTATKVTYDLHQFMGAMGLTLEHPLHRWTYRVKLLRSELGGAAAQFQSVADEIWGKA